MAGLNWVDRTVGYFFPRAGMQRIAARATFEYLQRAEKERQDRQQRFSYEGARTGRRTEGWTAGSTSANAEVGAGIVSLRNRSRELVRNNRYARKAVKELTGAIVGTGIELQANTPDKALNTLLQEYWNKFCQECDAYGQLDFYGLQRQAARAVVESGEVFSRFRNRRLSDGLAVPFQIQVLESDYVDHTKSQTLSDGSGYILQGIECNWLDQRRAYYVYYQHPGEVIITNAKGYYQTARVPAYDIVHAYDKERPGQMRGIPWLSAVMLALRDLDDYEDAERFRKKIEACVVAFVTQAPGETGASPVFGTQTTDTTVTPNKLVEAFEPGMIERLATGQDIKFNNPQPTGGFREYKTTELQGIAAGADVTYERMTSDFANVTFSSWRGGDNSFRKNVEAFQWDMFVPMYLRPIWMRFIDTLIGYSKIPADTPYDVEFHMPPLPSIDPEGDRKAELMDIRAGTKTFKQAIIERGRDPERHCAEIAESNALLDKYEIISDADPRKVQKYASSSGGDGGGQSAQPTQPAQPAQPAPSKPASKPASKRAAGTAAAAGKTGA